MSFIAALTSPESQVKLMCNPKEVEMGSPWAPDLYAVNGTVHVDEATGSVLPQYEAELLQLLQQLQERYRLVSQPRRGTDGAELSTVPRSVR
jgi:hypothetical protein